ncbi:terpene synthase family protein [Amycolatopsis sp. CA-161197]|uniref:terpene synthase family protein n=1 Tax=Amycolatopsis sp. CA-161197 TaxID=3239922 RepID=UPI003D8CC965
MAELYFPFPVHSEIGHEDYDREAAKWLSRYSDLPQEQVDAIVRSRTAAVMAFLAAPASAERLKPTVVWGPVYFLVDDILEAASTEEAAIMAACGQRIWDDPDASAPDTPITAMVRQNARELLALATPVQRQRLRSAHQRYFAAIVSEHLLEAATQPPSVEVYTAVREAASIMPAMSAVVEFATGMEIPEHEFHSRSVQAFLQTVHLATSWGNDVATIAKDFRDGHHNLVTVLAHRAGCGVKDAVNEAIAVISSVFYAMDMLSRELMREGGPALCAYVRSMIRMEGAFIPWQLYSSRYSDVLADDPLTTTDTAPDGVETPPDIAAIAWWWDHLPVRDAA